MFSKNHDPTKRLRRETQCNNIVMKTEMEGKIDVDRVRE
jgi:hypothetical protein